MSVCLESKRNTKKSTASSAKRSFGRKPRSEILEFLFLMLDHCRNNHVPPPHPHGKYDHNGGGRARDSDEKKWLTRSQGLFFGSGCGENFFTIIVISEFIT